MIASRCLAKPAAAAYCELTPRGFDDWVRRKIVPGPIPGTYRWDRKALDAALDKLSGLGSMRTEPKPGEAPEGQPDLSARYAEWKRQREGRT